MAIDGRTVEGVDSPISTAHALLDRRGGRRPLLDLSQAAPPYPPPPPVVDRIVEVARHPEGGTYTEVPGLPALRAAIAADVARDYGGALVAEDVVVTAGCNQAFCLVASALTRPGDEVVLALPYYFNHDMWLRMNGIAPVYLDPGPDGLPRAGDAAALVTPRTRALVLVTPGNPTGATLPPAAVAEFAEFARRRGIALVLDETYRSFRDTDDPPHRLFDDPGWPDTVISLHSFSKELAIPGYRVGAVIASAAVQREVCKLLDCVAVCAPRIGQEAALAGLGPDVRDWRRDRAREMAHRRAWLAAAMADRPGGFGLESCGAFFGWVRHPFAGRPTADVARDLVTEHDVLVVPGTAFLPDDRSLLRVSVGNVDQAAIADLAERLRGLPG
jgi:aspartate/methionine/tyrosine aminotransferase